jgi:hypothetical protein
MFRMALIACVLLSFEPSFASDQVPENIELGSRVRATYVVHRASGETDEKEITGVLQELDENSVMIRESISDGGTKLRLEDVSLLELSVAESRKGNGVLVGLGIGVASGVLLGFVSGDDDDSEWPAPEFSAGEKALILGIVFAPIGMLIGYFAAPGEKWAPVDVGQVQLGAGTAARQVNGVYVTMRF